jgi:phenylpyruvate tautomerase PptA (4-oxalocrotonate tautomerase family)
VAPPQPHEQDDEEDYEVAGLENAEKEALAIKLAIAAALGCPEDAIDVVLEDLDGTLELAGVVVFLDPTQARAIRS